MYTSRIHPQPVRVQLRRVETLKPTPTLTPAPTPTPTPTPAAPPVSEQPAATPVPTAAPVAAPPPGTHEDWMTAAGIAPSDFGYVDYIVGHEDGSWDPTRFNNEGSGAYGLCQSEPGGKMASAGADWQTNPVTQLRWCAGYAAQRYGSWAAAYAHWLAWHSW